MILFSSQLQGRSSAWTFRTSRTSRTFQTSRTFPNRFFAGGHRGVVIPVPIPNTEVKGSIAEGSAGLARARVGRRRLFLCRFSNGIKTFHLTHLIHLIDKPCQNEDSFGRGFSIKELRETRETADAALRARFFLLMDVIPVEKANG